MTHRPTAGGQRFYTTLGAAPTPRGGDFVADVPLINILSMNCWGLKFISTLRSERLDKIAERIAAASPKYDIVALQEVWVYSDYENLRKKTSGVLPFGKFYWSGAIGGGLVILSKWPIEQTMMYRYPLNGRPTAVHRGDFYVGKGVAFAAVRHPSGQLIDVFNTHLHAPYESNDTYLCHRTAQAWEIAKLLRGAVQKNHVAIGLGDFNMIPSSLAHRIISTHGLVADSWLSAFPDTPSVIPDNTIASDGLEFHGATCDSVLNTWRTPKGMVPTPESQDPRAKRLDYIFHSPKHSSVKAIKVGMTEPVEINGQKHSLSDHFSVEVTLALLPNQHQQYALSRGLSMEPVPHDRLIEIAGDARAEEAEIVNQVGEKDEQYLPQDVLEEILAVRKKYYEKEVREKSMRLGHFWASIPALVAVHVGVWWSPHNGVAFMLTFLAWVIAVTGGLNGLIGFIFVNSELRALKEFEQEILMYKTLAERASYARRGSLEAAFLNTETGKGSVIQKTMLDLVGR